MANATERQGIGYCLQQAAKKEWMFRDQPIDDVGIDAHMEMVDETGKPKQLLAIQIKSGESWFGEVRDGHVIFRDINDRQYHYWTKNSLPCILVLYNPISDVCIWEKLTEDTYDGVNYNVPGTYLVQLCVEDAAGNKRIKSFNVIVTQKISYC